MPLELVKKRQNEEPTFQRSEESRDSTSAAFPTAVTPEKRAQISSFDVFDSFLEKRPDGSYCTKKLLSPECYKRWLSTREKIPKLPEESFRRAITAHVRGTHGRKPFSPKQEMAVLKLLRKRKRWKCFDTPQNIGKLGYQKLGFHEERMLSSGKMNAVSNPVSLKLSKKHSSEYNEDEISIVSLCSSSSVDTFKKFQIERSRSREQRILSSCNLKRRKCSRNDCCVSPLTLADGECFCTSCVLGRVKKMDMRSYMEHLQKTTALLTNIYSRHQLP